jgi:PAS domain-containing protein
VALPGNLAMQPGPQAAELLRAHQRALQGKTWHGEVEWGGRFFQTAVEPLLDRQGHIAGTVGAALDVTGVDRGEQLHYVQHEVTRVLAGSLSFPEAIPRVLPLIGDAFAWATGAFWSVDRETRRMRCVAVWSRNPDTSQPFLFETEGLHYHMSACIPGKVWYTRQPLWIADVALDLSFRRADVAAAAGLRGGLWLPVLAGGDVLGVLELMNTHGQAPEPEARLLLEDVCRQLGEFGRRWRAEEVTKQLATVLEASPDCVGLCDLNGRPLYVNRAGRTLLGLGADGDLARFRLADFFPPAMARRVLEEGVPAALAQGAWQGETALLNLRTGEATPVSQVLICHKRADGSPEFFSTVARRVRRRDAASG